MMMSIGSYVRRGQRFLRRWICHPRLRWVVRGGGYFLGGFLLSAAGLRNSPLPLSLGALCGSMEGWMAVLLALGSAVGYHIFWGSAGVQATIWTLAGLVIHLSLGGRKLSRAMPMLLSILAGLSVAVTGLLFQLWQAEHISVFLYLLRIAIAIGSAKVFSVVSERRDPVMDWLACGMVVLALAQVAPIPQLGLGFLAAGALGAAAPFPAAALAGLSLDLAQITPVPMAAVMCLSFLVRLIPRTPKWTAHMAPALMYLMAAPLCGVADVTPVLALAIGGVCGIFLPGQTTISHRRGETGMAQVRLEITAAVMAQTEQLLLEVRENPIDEEALIAKAADRACSTCPCRKNCRDQALAARMSPSLLHRPLTGVGDLSINCRKSGRLLLEMRRGQDQYRAIKADRDRQKEYRSALIQQYRFLSEYLQELADRLPRRGDALPLRYEPKVAVCTAGLESANGDRCLWFAGTEGNYYVLLCDGMGTGFGAEEECRTALTLLRRLLTAGYPAEYALRSLNSLCTLRNRAGAVTVDLAQIELHNGKVSLYKWGAAPSYLVTPSGPEKIGTASPPPGLSVTDTRETVDKLSLRRGETLILLSDGVDGEGAMRRAWEMADDEPGEMASKVLQYGRGNGQDDATAAVIRLKPTTLST